jgi:DNA-binding Lrp family transcriptional regulator
MFGAHSKLVVSLKELELKLVSELMKNSRRSDRELAKALGVSQPTVSRTIQKLEEMGVIKEYTMIPDFKQLGYGLLTVTLVKHKSNLTPEKLSEAERKGLDHVQTLASSETVMAERGMGFGYDAVIVAYEKDYSEHRQHIEGLKTFAHLETAETQSFIVDLKDKVHYRSFTYSTLANHLTKQKQNKE